MTGAYFEYWTSLIDDEVWWEGIINFDTEYDFISEWTNHVKICLEYLPYFPEFTDILTSQRE